MLLEVYRSILTCAAGWPTSKNIEVGFTFNEQETVDFWASKNGEPEMLTNEWESPKPGLYTKVLYGKKFYIQFSYSK